MKKVMSILVLSLAILFCNGLYSQSEIRAIDQDAIAKKKYKESLTTKDYGQIYSIYTLDLAQPISDTQLTELKNNLIAQGVLTVSYSSENSEIVLQANEGVEMSSLKPILLDNKINYTESTTTYLAK